MQHGAISTAPARRDDVLDEIASPQRGAISTAPARRDDDDLDARASHGNLRARPKTGVHAQLVAGSAAVEAWEASALLTYWHPSHTRMQAKVARLMYRGETSPCQDLLVTCTNTVHKLAN
jgi:hypothetical protein